MELLLLLLSALAVLHCADWLLLLLQSSLEECLGAIRAGGRGPPN